MRFLYCEILDGGMDTFFIDKLDDLNKLNGWMSASCINEDIEFLAWIHQARIGDYFHHRLGTAIRVNPEGGPMAVNRVKDWESFSKKVLTHIKQYTIPQYQTPDGDDQVEKFTAHDCVQNIKRYINRFGTNARGGRETLRDLIKVAHYTQFAYDKLRKEQGMADIYEEEK